MWFLLPTLAAAAPEGCAKGANRASLAATLASGETAAVSLDAGGLGIAVRHLQLGISCLDEALEATDAAAFFRLSGLASFVEGRPDEARAWFVASRTLQPAFGLDPALGATLAAAWNAAAPSAAGPIELQPPDGGWLVIDGRREQSAPSDRPYVLQWFDESGAVRLTDVVVVGAPRPPYPVSSAAQPESSDRGRPSRALLVSGLALGALGGAGLGTAAALKSAFQGSDELSTAQEGKISANRAIGWSGYSLCAAAGAVGVSAVVVGRW